MAITQNLKLRHRSGADVARHIIMMSWVRSRYSDSALFRHPCAAELFVSIFPSFEAVTADAISSFKWGK